MGLIIPSPEGFYQNQVIHMKTLCKVLCWWKELFPHPFILSDKSKGLFLEYVKTIGFKVGIWKDKCVVRARRDEGRVKDVVKWYALYSRRMRRELSTHTVRVCNAC